jgi:hypothetical protein
MSSPNPKTSHDANNVLIKTRIAIKNPSSCSSVMASKKRMKDANMPSVRIKTAITLIFAEILLNICTSENADCFFHYMIKTKIVKY